MTKFGQKPYRYYHYPWPDIIGTARADKRHHPEYQSNLTHEQIIKNFLLPAARNQPPTS